jgi:hypothetical protein
LVLLLVGLVTIFLSVGCGPGSGEGLDEDGNLLAAGGATGGAAGAGAGGGGVGAGGASGNLNATLAWVQANVFDSRCIQCHQGASAPKGVDWTTPCGNVERPSVEIPSLKEIARGDPAASYVIWKVEGQGPSGQRIDGGRMPLGLSPLTPDTIKNMRDWIADGVPGCP